MTDSLPTSFKAATLPSAFSKNVTSSRSLAPLEPNEVAIKITATAINPVDWKMQLHDEFLPSYPAILGSDASGTIVSLGPSVQNFAVGDRVFFQGIIGNPDFSTFQQYCKMPVSLISATPSNVTDEQAASISLATMAVVTAFYDKANGHSLLPPWEIGGESVGQGKSVVVIGGASSVGQYAVQIARLSGFSRIITNASPANHELLKTLGAHAVLDRSHSAAEDFAAAIEDVPLEFVFDAISAKTTQILSVQIVQAAERREESVEVVTVHTVVPSVLDAEAVALGKEGNVKVHVKQVLGIGSSKELRYLSEPLMRALGGEEGWIAKGAFVPNRPRVVQGGLESVEAALELNRRGVSGEKVIIRPWDT